MFLLLDRRLCQVARLSAVWRGDRLALVELDLPDLAGRDDDLSGRDRPDVRGCFLRAPRQLRDGADPRENPVAFSLLRVLHEHESRFLSFPLHVDRCFLPYPGALFPVWFLSRRERLLAGVQLDPDDRPGQPAVDPYPLVPAPVLDRDV